MCDNAALHIPHWPSFLKLYLCANVYLIYKCVHKSMSICLENMRGWGDLDNIFLVTALLQGKQIISLSSTCPSTWKKNGKRRMETESWSKFYKIMWYHSTVIWVCYFLLGKGLNYLKFVLKIRMDYFKVAFVFLKVVLLIPVLESGSILS